MSFRVVWLSFSQESRARPNFTYKLKIILGFMQIATNLQFVVDVPWPVRCSRCCFHSLMTFARLRHAFESQVARRLFFSLCASCCGCVLSP